MKYAIMMQKVVDVAGIFSWEVTMVKLIKGESDLATLHPDLVKEWHPIKNGDLMPEDISSGSGKEVWWLCPEGHTYSMVVNQRTKRGYAMKPNSYEIKVVKRCPKCNWRIFDKVTPTSGIIELKCPNCRKIVEIDLSYRTPIRRRATYYRASCHTYT